MDWFGKAVSGAIGAVILLAILAALVNADLTEGQVITVMLVGGVAGVVYG